MKTEAIQKLKEKHPDTLFILRSGDFYSLYGEDAKTASACLGLTLTKTVDGEFQTVFKHSELDRYLPKLIRAGHRVAICDEP
jgi:DNA mismatch repair protein MutS